MTLGPTRVNPAIAAQPAVDEAMAPHSITAVANGAPQLVQPGSEAVVSADRTATGMPVKVEEKK